MTITRKYEKNQKFTVDDIITLDDFQYSYMFDKDLTDIIDVSSNYSVEDILRSEKVILPRNTTDTEYLSLVVLFKTHKSAVNFIERLNNFLNNKKIIEKIVKEYNKD